VFQPGIGTTPAAPTHDEAAQAPDDALYFQRCRWCGTTMFNRLLCRVCASTDLEVMRSEGVGVIHRSIILRRDSSAARSLSLIDMAEGFSVRCRVIGPPKAVHEGARVKLARGIGPGSAELLFQLCDGAYGGITH
jgi:uncharacterized protein